MALHYNAFISYKHAPADIAVAKDIQHQLEHYHIPKVVRQKTGKDRIERIFRDQEELPITSDLSKDIDEALQDAEFLIVICSSSTKLSTWVPREIARFLEFHDRDHVLTVLVDGEPNEVIPKILLEEISTGIDENGTEEEHKTVFEPLSCDYRGSIRQARKTEIPRLAAALLGCSYDELVMRARQYKMRRLTAIGTAAGIMAAVAIGYLIWSNRQIRSNYEQAQANLLEARRNQITMLGNEALDEIGEDNYILAAQLALSALPGEGREDWPRMALPEYALSRAVGAYNTYFSTASYSNTWDMEMRGNILDFQVERSTNVVYAYDFYNDIAAWKLDTFEKLFHLEPGREIEAVYILNHDEKTDLLVNDEDGIHLLDGMTGTAKWTFDAAGAAEGDLVKVYSWVSDDYIPFAFVWNTVRVNAFDYYYTMTLCRLDPANGGIVWKSEPLNTEYCVDYVCSLSQEENSFYFVLNRSDSCLLYCADLKNGQIRQITPETDFVKIYHLYQPRNGRMTVFGCTDKERNGAYGLYGKYVLKPLYGTLLCIETGSGKTAWTNDFTSCDLNYLQQKRWCWRLDHTDPQGQQRSLLLILYGHSVRLYDETDGSLYEEFNLPSELVSVNTRVDGSGFYSVLRNGTTLNYILDRGSAYLNTDFQKTINQAVMCFPHDERMGFVCKTDRTKLQLFEVLYDSEKQYFTNAQSYLRNPAQTVVIRDRFLLVTEQPDYKGYGYADLYDIEAKASIWHIGKEFEGKITPLGLDASGKYALMYQTFPHRILVFDINQESTEPVFSYDLEEGTGFFFGNCFMFRDQICVLQGKYSGPELLFLDVMEDGSVEPAGRTSVPDDPELDFHTDPCVMDADSHFVLFIQLPEEGYVPEDPPILRIYDPDNDRWLRTDFVPDSEEATLDYLPDQELMAIADTKKVQVFDRDSKLIYTIYDPARTVKAIYFCPASQSGLDEDLLFVVNRDENYRMDRYRASDGTFLGSTSLTYYSSDSTKAHWSITEGEVVLQLDDVVNIIDMKEWIHTALAGSCIVYSPSCRTFVSYENPDDYNLVWFPRYSMEDLIRKGQDFLHGLEMSDSTKAIYGISE